MNGVSMFQKFYHLADEATAWRRHLHQNPELDFAVHETARFVTEKLVSFGINYIETGIAGTGVVAFIQGEGGDGPTIGLRTDMDALPIHEVSG
ncbi:MAG: amidohydrolase, partial [Mesorhizobium sp.]